MTDELERLRRMDVGPAAHRAAEALAETAHRRGLVDVAFGTVDTPLGTITIFVTRQGLVRVSYPEERLDHIFEEVSELITPRVLEDAKGTERARRELDAYFEGRLRRFRLPIDWAFVTEGFRRRVLEATARIPFGSVSTYGDVALRAGSPRAYRAAGNALHGNPVPIVVPCHRVVPASGGIGQYGGDEWRKAWLLRMEGAFPD